MKSKSPMPVNNVKLTDVLDVVVCGYVVNYWHSNLPVLHSKKFHSKRALMHWLETNKSSLFFSGKPIFTIETIMKVAGKPESIDKVLNF